MDVDLSIVLVGLPNAGKSLIFNIITGLNSEVSPYPISTTKPLHGIVEWVDPRMAKIADIIRPEKIYPLRIQVTDTTGIIPEQNQSGSGFAEALASMRSSDVLCHVVRSFVDTSVLHTFQDIDMKRDSTAVWEEYCKIDSDLINARVSKLERMIIKGTKDPEILFENDLLKHQVIAKLNAGIPLCKMEWNEKEIRLFDSLALVTHKPRFFIVNYGEKQIEEHLSDSQREPNVIFANETVLPLCAQLEFDIMSLPSDEQADYLSLYDGFSLASYKIVPTALDTINRITYFTFGPLGLKQWSVPKGTTAVGAAKRLHTDFANKFIAAEVTCVDILTQVGSVEQIKSQGKMKLEGRDYIVNDGDILYFRFNK